MGYGLVILVLFYLGTGFGITSGLWPCSAPALRAPPSFKAPLITTQAACPDPHWSPGIEPGFSTMSSLGIG
jgi:hypothetical protein